MAELKVKLSAPPPAISIPKATNGVIAARSTRSTQKEGDETDEVAASTATAAATAAPTATKKRSIVAPTFQLSGKSLCSSDIRSDLLQIMKDTKARSAELASTAAPVSKNTDLWLLCILLTSCEV